jgi:hypothetical protein
MFHRTILAINYNSDAHIQMLLRPRDQLQIHVARPATNVTGFS